MEEKDFVKEVKMEFESFIESIEHTIEAKKRASVCVAAMTPEQHQEVSGNKDLRKMEAKIKVLLKML